AYRNRVLGVILTGTLDDGAAGLWAVKQCGGLAIVQSDAQFSEMPQNAIESVEVDYHLPLAEIAPLLSRLVQEPMNGTPLPSVPQIVRANDRGAKMEENDIVLDDVADRTIFSCSECNGALWEAHEGKL